MLNKIKENIIYVICLFLIFFSIIYFYKNTYQNIKVYNLAEQSRIKEESIYKAPNEKDHYKIKSNSSRVTIINYFSLDCVHCRKAYKLEEDNLNVYKEKINIIYRHNPLDIQPLSAEKALISECVYVLNNYDNIKFFNFIKEIFGNYNLENKDNDWVKKIANSFVESKNTLDSCLDDINIKNSIEKQKNENIISGITFTPTLLIYIDGKFIKKFDNLSAFQVDKIFNFYSILKIE